ncbi:MAG: bifunctional precorrin-2 dehydrogenase/sirohydrochlorin ferrochelatase [Armatimonadetes bacterium]|nr:bifunctional precorrin-2 dehydrogenase/sirohydrochlorin ferrochelatase [Armatimonadota bacterium]
MAYYPIAIDLTGRKVLVVGGGTVALRKVETLLEFGAEVTVVAPQIVPEIERLAESGSITVERREYRSEDAAGAVVIITSTDDEAVNRRVSEDALARNILVNVVDVPELCGFIVPATVKRGDLTISISTAGKSPALARRVREKIEEIFGPEYGEFADLLGEMREMAKSRIKSQPERERAFKQMLNSQILELLRAGRDQEARSLALSIVNESSNG